MSERTHGVTKRCSLDPRFDLPRYLDGAHMVLHLNATGQRASFRASKPVQAHERDRRASTASRIPDTTGIECCGTLFRLGEPVKPPRESRRCSTLICHYQVTARQGQNDGVHYRSMRLLVTSQVSLYNYAEKIRSHKPVAARRRRKCLGCIMGRVAGHMSLLLHCPDRGLRR